MYNVSLRKYRAMYVMDNVKMALTLQSEKAAKHLFILQHNPTHVHGENLIFQKPCNY